MAMGDSLISVVWAMTKLISNTRGWVAC